LSNQVLIYTLSHPTTGDVRYIGQTSKSLENRLIRHLYEARQNKCYRHRWIISLIKLGLTPKIELLDHCETFQWSETERYWISMFKFWGFKLVNGDDGGRGTKGLKHSEETKKILSASRRGIPQSQETVQKRVAKNTGKKRSKEFCDKNAKWWIGRNHRPETREKMSLAKRGKRPSDLAMSVLSQMAEGNKLRVAQYDLNGNFIKEFSSIIEASRETEIPSQNIGANIKGRYKHAGGFIWKKV
jgi:group I intron endonuclease